MRSNVLFYFGLALNAITLLLAIGNVTTMFEPTQNLDGTYNGGHLGDNMTEFGRLITWFIPLGLLVFMALAFWLRSKGKLLGANILVSIIALPLLAAIVFWVGFALLFILFGN